MERTKYPFMTITKLEAARRELATAIDLWFAEVELLPSVAELQ
jgi:hypothetical protein